MKINIAPHTLAYRIAHVLIWTWVFFVLPGNLVFDLFSRGPGVRHAIWLAIVAPVCLWRGIRNRLPGVEPYPYLAAYGPGQPNFLYRRVCYTAAWIELIVPFVLDFAALAMIAWDEKRVFHVLYGWPYYALAVVVAAFGWLGWLPHAAQKNEGAEKAWFYVAFFTAVPAHGVAAVLWIMGDWPGVEHRQLSLIRFAIFAAIAATGLVLSLAGKLPRTKRELAAQNLAPVREVSP